MVQKKVDIRYQIPQQLIVTYPKRHHHRQAEKADAIKDEANSLPIDYQPAIRIKNGILGDRLCAQGKADSEIFTTSSSPSTQEIRDGGAPPCGVQS